MPAAALLLEQRAGEGGCWKPYPNMVVGFTHAGSLIRRYGLRAGLRGYNGSGPAAERYAAQVLGRLERWKRIVRERIEPKPARVVVNPTRTRTPPP